MKNRHFIIVSFDALSSRDLIDLKHLPGFQRLKENSSYCLNVSSVYPSLTYPCHTSISTGMYPKNHGVESNTLLQLNRTSRTGTGHGIPSRQTPSMMQHYEKDFLYVPCYGQWLPNQTSPGTFQKSLPTDPGSIRFPSPWPMGRLLFFWTSTDALVT